MKIPKTSFILLLAMATVSALNAATTYTTLPDITGNYHDTGQTVWGQAGSPGAADTVHVRDSATVDVNNGLLNEASVFHLANRGNGTLNITSGTFNATSTTTASTIGGIAVGESVGGNGTLNISGSGSANFNAILDVGLSNRGVVNVGTGGSLYIEGLNPNGSIRAGHGSGAYGEVNITGGTVTTGNNVFIGSAAGGSGLLTMSAGSLTVGRSLFIANRATGTTTGEFTMTGGHLFVKNEMSNADYLIIGGSTSAAQDTQGTAKITGGTVDANIIVGGNSGAGTGKLILGPNITAINPVTSTYVSGDAIPLALSLRGTGTLQFDLGADLSFNMIDLSAGKVQFFDGAAIILNAEALGSGLSPNNPIDLLKIDMANFTDAADPSSVTYTVIGNTSGLYEINLAWNNDHTILQAVVTAIPEPATYALLSALFAGIAVMLRRRKK